MPVAQARDIASELEVFLALGGQRFPLLERTNKGLLVGTDRAQVPSQVLGEKNPWWNRRGHLAPYRASNDCETLAKLSWSPASAILRWRSLLSWLSAGAGRFMAVITRRWEPTFCAFGGLPGEERAHPNPLDSCVVATYASIPLAPALNSRWRAEQTLLFLAAEIFGAILLQGCKGRGCLFVMSLSESLYLTKPHWIWTGHIGSPKARKGRQGR